MTETDKITARIHLFEPDLIAGLFAQGVAKGQPKGMDTIFASVKPPHHIPNPLLGLDITVGDSLTVEAWVSPVPYDALARPVLACGQTNGTGALFHFFAPGGRGRALAVLFRGANETTAHAMATENITQLGAPGLHHVVMVVDGNAQIASFLVDGILLDGSDDLGTGFVELAGLSHSGLSRRGESGGSGAATECMVGGDVKSLRIYGSKRGSGQRGFLRTSEVVASFRGGLKHDDDDAHADRITGNVLAAQTAWRNGSRAALPQRALKLRIAMADASL